MPEVIFPGPDGRLEGRYHPQKTKDAPIAILTTPASTIWWNNE
jgi:alpha/beta superfamily hydrolase